MHPGHHAASVKIQVSLQDSGRHLRGNTERVISQSSPKYFITSRVLMFITDEELTKDGTSEKTPPPARWTLEMDGQFDAFNKNNTVVT